MSLSKHYYFWVLLLICGCIVIDRPAGRRVKRFLFHWQSARQWEQRTATPNGPESAWLTIPSAGIDTLVLNGFTAQQLNLAPCLEPILNNTLILSHRDTHFRGLKNINLGDVIRLELRDGTKQTYRISDTLIINASESEKVLRNIRNRNSLILFTCYPFSTIGPAPSRILILANPI